MDKALVAAERAAAENLTSRQRARWRGLCFCELCKKNEAETDMRCNHVTLKTAAKHWNVDVNGVLGHVPPMFITAENVLSTLRGVPTGGEEVEEVRTWHT
jgi:hypothetical protein